MKSSALSFVFASAAMMLLGAGCVTPKPTTILPTENATESNVSTADTSDSVDTTSWQDNHPSLY
ncbi:MAG: hypothetical protein AAB865_02270, partial [Patescibacteria group bacterium]